MALKIAAFPKCYIEQIAGERSMSVFDWIEMARSLDADGLEMYDGFFTSLEPSYLDQVGEAIAAAGFVMPMLCCSPDFTNPNLDSRKRAVDHRHLVVQELGIVLVEVNALLDDRLTVGVGRHAGRIERTRALQVAGLDLEHIEAAVAILVDPSADRIAEEGRRDLLGPVAAVGIDPGDGSHGRARCGCRSSPAAR